MARRYWLIGVIVIGAAVVDQGSKAVALMTLSQGEQVELLGRGVVLRIARNEGVAWGLGAALPEGFRRVAFPLLGGMVAVVLLASLRYFPEESTVAPVAVALILGGGLGNGVDRVLRGAVVDFMGFDVGGEGWSMSGTLNVADLWMIAGVALLLMTLVREPRRPGLDGSRTRTGGSP